MNNLKTGVLIANLRKQKNLTQGDLALKLGVTDKAVSRWETGRGFPDVSLLKPLAETLEVSVNEIITGENIPAEQIRQKSDETLIHTLTESKKKIDRIINGLLFSLAGILLVFSLLFLGYDTSWVSIYSFFGVLILAVAVFRLFRKKPIKGFFAALLTLLLAFGIFEARDYAYVTWYGMPPLYNLSITTTFPNDEKTIRYHKLFYDVLRDHVDTEIEVYKIIH